MTDFYLGIDIGGTKTHALIATGNAEAIGFGEAGTGNHEAVGYDGMEEVLIETTHQALAMAASAWGRFAEPGSGSPGTTGLPNGNPCLQALAGLPLLPGGGRE